MGRDAWASEREFAWEKTTDGERLGWISFFTREGQGGEVETPPCNLLLQVQQKVVVVVAASLGGLGWGNGVGRGFLVRCWLGL